MTMNPGEGRCETWRRKLAKTGWSQGARALRGYAECARFPAMPVSLKAQAVTTQRSAERSPQRVLFAMDNVCRGSPVDFTILLPGTSWARHETSKSTAAAVGAQL